MNAHGEDNLPDHPEQQKRQIHNERVEAATRALHSLDAHLRLRRMKLFQFGELHAVALRVRDTQRHHNRGFDLRRALIQLHT